MSYSDLVGLMSEASVRQQVSRGRIVQVRRGCSGNCALFSVDSLPARVRSELVRRERVGSGDVVSIVDMIELDMAAARYYMDYKFDGVRGLDEHKQRIYTNDASILNMFRVMLERSDALHKKQSKSCLNRGEFWLRASGWLESICEVYENDLPRNGRRLQSKYNAYYRGGERHYDVLISGKFSNRNTSLIRTEEQEALLLSLIADHRNLDSEQVAMLYNMVAERLEGWKCIKSATVRTWREKYDLETSAARLGKSEFYNQRALQVSRRKPSSPMLLWSLDGWDVELYYQKQVNGVTTYHNRLVLEVVLDAYNNYPIGYAIGEQEDTSLITRAMQNAMNHTKELFGERMRVDVVQSDHYAMKSMQPIYQVCGDKFIPARVGNAKSKPIERYFGYLNKRYCQLLNNGNWSGFGITSDRRKQPNSDALNMRRKGFPDRESLERQIELMMELERKEKVSAYMEGWSKVGDEYRRVLSLEQYLLAFGAETGYKNALSANGLNIRILGERRQYDSTDINFRRYSHIRWNVRYDPSDLCKVLAVSDEGDLRFVLTEKYVQPMALADRVAGDAEQLALIARANKSLEEHITNTLADGHKKVEVLFSQNPQLQNVLTRSLLVDSSGQHKQRRYEIANGQVAALPDNAADNVPTDNVSTYNLY